jgi:hypothetical protein
MQVNCFDALTEAENLKLMDGSLFQSRLTSRVGFDQADAFDLQNPPVLLNCISALESNL